ncbi:fibronectin type III domain-containing protein [Helicobacter sp. 23-1044]
MMRYYASCLCALICSVFFSACGGIIATLEGEDSALPVIKNIKTISDVGAIAFEWEIISDERVSGIVIYKEKNGEFSEIAHLENPQITHFVDENLTPETLYRYKFKSISKTHFSAPSEIVEVKTSYIDAVERVFASNDYPRQIKLIFSPHPNPSIAYYLIQREVEGKFKTIALVNHRLLPEYFDKNLESGASYKYRIIAVNHAKNPSRPSQIITAKTKSPPPPPQNLNATQNLLQKITLSWEAQSGAKSYNIYRANKESGRFLRIATTKSTSHTDNISENGASYFYKIQSVDDDDLKSTQSPAIVGKTKAPPPAPQISQGFVDNNVAKIAWNAVDGAKHYVVYRIDSSSGKQERFKATQNNFDDRDASSGEFSYFVVAVDGDNLESAPSNKIILSIK